MVRSCTRVSVCLHAGDGPSGGTGAMRAAWLLSAAPQCHSPARFVAPPPSRTHTTLTRSDQMSKSATVEPLLPVELGAGKIKFAQGMKAGRWVFASGLMAQDFVNGIAPDVLAERTPHAGLPKRE